MGSKKPFIDRTTVNSILFAPICGKCGQLIWAEVNCIARIPEGDNCSIYPEYIITPNKCPQCGTYFNRISMPTQLPFRTSDFVR